MRLEKVARGLANERGRTLSTASITDDTALRDLRNTVFKIVKVYD